MARAMHCARMAAWQVDDAAGAAAAKVAAMVDLEVSSAALTFAGLSPWRRWRVRQSVVTLHLARWLVLQRLKVAQVIKQVLEDPTNLRTETELVQSVDQVLNDERKRGVRRGGPISLLWWYWPADMWTEIREGYRLPLDRPAVPFRGDNYESTECEKVYI